MDVHFTPDQEELVRVAVESGRLRDASEAAQEAFGLWERRERKRQELAALLNEGEADFTAGRFASYTEETLPQFFEEVKREARALHERKKASLGIQELARRPARTLWKSGSISLKRVSKLRRRFSMSSIATLSCSERAFL